VKSFFLYFPNGSHLPKNFHLVVAPMSCAMSPTGLRMGSQEKEAIDIDDDDTYQTAWSKVRLNWSHAEDT